MQEPETQLFADAEIPDTEVIVVAHPSPVFVDSTGRRRRLLRRVAYGFGALCMVYGGLISVSLAGGPVSPSAVLPLPDLADGDDEAIAAVRPSPTPGPFTAVPSTRPVMDVLPRGDLPIIRRTVESGVMPRSVAPTARPSRTPTPRTTTKPTTTPTPTKLVESSTTKPNTPGPTVPPTGTPTTPADPVPPAPPIPPGTGETGGTGGGTPSDDDGEDEEGGAANGTSNPPPPPVIPIREPADVDQPAVKPAEEPAAEPAVKPTEKPAENATDAGDAGGSGAASGDEAGR
ncbi:hypothetical protein BG844_02970 [Couchioplanes caeruleus subsp. caeruleus]|uniref:Uncharacterized protein n=1 Tax=Couchioplanes caeruleus subsp. caeruleus TaxID=56427 RepID=A0A1K0GEN9_9ACTN|nr:hypothetical protein BG844_02970 [Couchioplanes caeruleus subsp. caeruleus]